MLRVILLSITLLVFTSNLPAETTEQQELNFSKAWYKPKLIENNDLACNDLLKDAQEKYFGKDSFEATYGIQGYGYTKTGEVLDWTIVLGEGQGQIEAYGKTFYLDYINNSGCGGACETNQPLVSDKPFPETRDYDHLRVLANDAPPAASYTYTIAQTPQKIVYLFIVGSNQEYKNKILIYKLSREARWKPACTISIAPRNIKNIEDSDISPAINSINKLNQSIAPLSGSAGNCGSMGTAWRWKEEISESLEQALYRPWALSISREHSSENSYGDYKRINQQLELWSLTGISEYRAFASYKTQLQKSINDISVFYQKKYKWPDRQSKAMAEEALTSAVSRGFGFYMYDPQFSAGEEELRRSILEKKDISEVKSIHFDVENIDSKATIWDGETESQESVLNIAINYPEALQYLLERGINPNTKNGFGKTPLMYAAQLSQMDSAKILLNSGANPAAQTTNPNDTCNYTLQTFKMTPLHYAVRYASPGFIKLLLESGASPLMKAENNRNYPMVEETPLDWLHKYTTQGVSGRNQNIPDDKISEVEKWLQMPSSEANFLITK